MKSTGSAILVALTAIVVVVAVSVGIWYLGWGIHRANVNKDYQVNRESQNYQGALIQQERDRVIAFNTATDPGEQAQIRAQFCALYQDLTSKPNDLVSAAGHIGC